MNKASSLALRLAVVALALFCLGGLWRVIAVMGLHLPLDPNEGWNAYHAASAMAGAPLYPGPSSFMVNNYPPLSFYLVGALGRIVGDNIFVGRMVSLLSLCAVAFGIYSVARHMGCKRLEAAFAPLLFAAGMLAFTDYVGMDDPQMLAHAIAVAGFVVLLREPRPATRIAAAAMFFVLAFFVKHNVIVMPVAATAWLALHDRRSALRLAGFGIAFALIGLALFRLTYGINLLTVLHSARTFTLENFREGLWNWLHWSLVPLGGLVILTFTRETDRYVRLCAIYAAFGIILGLCFMGGAGVDANVLFDADIALALGTALLLDRLEDAKWRAAAAVAFTLPLFFAGWMNAGDDWRSVDAWLHPRRDEATLAQKDIAFLETRSGPALCEMQSFCYWAHKSASVDVFNVGEQFDTGVRSDESLAQQIEAHRFAAIQFDPDSPYSLGENVHNAVAHAYRLDHEDDFGDFYVPR